MTAITKIQQPVKSHLKSFDKIFKSYMKSDVALLDRITRYMIKRKGKQMRPLFVFLCAGINGKIDERSYRAASLIELLHTATLVHDDVVDESYKRRGFFSLNALWRNKISVLVGDYLLSRGLLLAMKHKDTDLLEIVSEAVKEMSEGELLQIEKARKLDIKEEVYFEIIRKKTASLIASCCATGAASAGASVETIESFRQFGENIGIAFQIKDDLFDYQKSTDSEKPSGIDIKEKKMTLPLIYMLKNAEPSDRRKIIYTIKNRSDDNQRVAEIIQKVNTSGGIEYAREKMDSYKEKAMQFLDSQEDSEYKKALKELVEYTISRSK